LGVGDWEDGGDGGGVGIKINLRFTPPRSTSRLFMMITGKTKLLGVIGYPIEHSLSPVMQNAAIAAMGLDYAYVPFAVAPDQLSHAIEGLWAIGVQGFNVTIPHKQAIMPLLKQISPVAQAVGAVNTVWRTEQGWSGTNTDVEGFLAPLKAHQRDWRSTQAVILGNGGAARAVVAGCMQLGCQQVQVVGRNLQNLESFRHSWQLPLLSYPSEVISDRLSVHLWDALPQLLPSAGLVINTTPIGMAPHAGQSPVDASLLQLLPPDAIVYDLIYTPRPTEFLRLAQAQGTVMIDGLEMLIQQGAAALQQWLQQPVPVEEMRRSLLNYVA
jgi:shikimate dehydrogenase